MKTLQSSIDIDASADRVWDILTDFAAYPTWNSYIPRVTGTATVGTQLEVRLEPPDGMAITLKPTVLEVVPGRSLRWLGHLLIAGIFDGEHHFRIEPRDGSRCRLVQQECFSGLLVPLFARTLDEHTLAGFQAMNAALRARAEAPVAERSVDLLPV